MSRRAFRTQCILGALAGLLVLTAAAGVSTTPPVAAPAAAPPVLPVVGAGTHLIDHTAALAGFSDQPWYEANIPFLDVPDQQVQDVYYYRWRTYKEHLRYTNPQDGWISTEFLDCCGYAAPYQAIDAAAGHQITEGRWLRDPTYGDDLVKFWTTGPGAGAKPATEDVNPATTDWAHEYSFWLASAAFGRAQATGETAELTALLPQLVRQYRGWDNQYNGRLGLYWSVPVWDAMEFSASSYRSSDPYHGGAGFRPTLNSYQYGDAVAISRIATLAGDPSTAAEYAHRAAALKAAMAKHLWDPTRDFFFHVARDGNPGDAPADTREEIGYIPWAFDAAPAGDEAAWKQLTDPQGFASAYGPTTAERRSPLFMKDAAGCCRWDGPSWPFATSQTLTGMANLLDDYPAQGVVTAAQYADQLHTYAATQFKDGKPYVAEAHSPDDPTWIYDGRDHSEDYNHSTFTDLVISGLIGLRASEGDRLPIKPLVPASWDHFALENVPYHGHNVTVAYDRAGTHYGIGTGMSVFVDGVAVTHTATVQAVTVTVPAAATPEPAATRSVDDAANPLRAGYPKPIASYTWRNDDAWNALDGKVFFDEVPEDTRWTNYSSPNAQDWYGVDFGAPTPVTDVRWYGYDDGGGVRPAADYRVQYLVGSTWKNVPGQRRATSTPVGNGLNRITFPAVTTSQLRLLFTNPPGAFVGVTEGRGWRGASRGGARAGGGAGGVTARPPGGEGGATVTVAVRNASAQRLTGITLTAAMSPGWRAVTSGAAFALGPGVVAHRTVTVVAPPGATPGSDAAVRVTAAFTQDGAVRSTHRQFPLRTAYPTGPTAPVADWPLDEGTGTTGHDTTGHHDLTVTGHAAWTPGRSGSALQFDGATAAATAGPVLDTAGNFTVAATVRLDSTDGFQTAVAQDDTTTSGFFLQYSGADGRLAFSTEQGRALANARPVVGRWYRLVGVHDANAGTYTLYVDGVAQSSVLHLDPGDASTGPFTVGRAEAGGNPTDYWHGAVDGVRAWARALPASEVAALR